MIQRGREATVVSSSGMDGRCSARWGGASLRFGSAECLGRFRQYRDVPAELSVLYRDYSQEDALSRKPSKVPNIEPIKVNGAFEISSCRGISNLARRVHVAQCCPTLELIRALKSYKQVIVQENRKRTLKWDYVLIPTASEVAVPLGTNTGNIIFIPRITLTTAHDTILLHESSFIFRFSPPSYRRDAFIHFSGLFIYLFPPPFPSPPDVGAPNLVQELDLSV
ncbi:hypothetical protein RRG08_060455 [Elysia crispata]|uniref:Uncharacterized protein n=1 Tax=Elysia crispata TaxID=231223 RepID=A0AAE1B1G2_9GAST|nr:hypothetical protein RRG08_060455 [Elysia crispata]